MNPSHQANGITIIQKLKKTALRPRFKNWRALIASFLAGQGIVQLLNFVIGFLLLRWLSVEAFAQYSVASGFQGTLAMLVDVGFSSSIVALAGNRVSDKIAIGRYIRSARHFRGRLFLIAAPLAAVAFPLVVAKHHWPVKTQLLLLLAILVAIFVQGWMSFYSAPLLINRNLRGYYQPQVISALGRTLICFLLYIGSALTSWVVVWLNAIVIAVTGLFYRVNSRPLVDEPARSDAQTNREMLSYLSPLIPGIVFYAFQGQIGILLITLFGQTRSIAEVGALGRLSQLFLLLGAFNSVIIGPYVATITHHALIRRYFQILGTAVLISLAMLTAALLFPQPLLWVLGAKYQNLHAEVNWLVVVSCISYVGGVMWTMHSARKWIYWWGTFAYIGLLLSTQVVCIVYMDLSTTINVIYFTLITSVVILVVHIATGIFGLTYGSARHA